jgi:hypothetical protein
MGSAIALREKSPTVPGTTSDAHELVKELKDLYVRLKVADALSGWSAAVNMLKNRPDKAESYLLVLNADDFLIDITGFKEGERAKAIKKYSETEKEIEGKPNMQAVLVSVDSVKNLRRAYPNYFLDTRVFLDTVEEAIKMKVS